MASAANMRVCAVALTDMKDSLAWQNTSMPVAAVISGGIESVKAGSTIATAG